MPDLRTAASHERGLRELGWRDWRSVLARAVLDMGDDAAALLSAGVAFYMFLSVFPALIAALTLYSLVADPVRAEQQVREILAALPGDARNVLAQPLDAVAADGAHALSWHLVLSVLAALWTASLGVTGLLKAVKIAYDEEEQRNVLELRWTGLLLTLGAIVFLVVAVGLLAVLPVWLDGLGLQGAARALVQVLRWAAVVLLAVVTLTLVYHLGADRSGAHPKWTGPGTVAAACVWTAINAGFSWYAGGRDDYGSTYGGLSGGVVLLLWLFLTSLAVLFGAEVNAEAERQARGLVRQRRKKAPWETVAQWWRARRPGPDDPLRSADLRSR